MTEVTMLVTTTKVTPPSREMDSDLGAVVRLRRWRVRTTRTA